ncbi:hypothetical protein LTR17_003359 [Elasticomyces elasticus]|nr:hypothetical protein LTR17_003359 [Elasticomyces elasticus]
MVEPRSIGPLPLWKVLAAALEFSGDSGKTWVKTTRDTCINNFFVAPGTLSSSTAWVRVTSHVGTTVVVKDVTLASGKITKATKNYA